jgi:hypothetical protein
MCFTFSTVTLETQTFSTVTLDFSTLVLRLLRCPSLVNQFFYSTVTLDYTEAVNSSVIV